MKYKNQSLTDPPPKKKNSVAPACQEKRYGNSKSTSVKNIHYANMILILLHKPLLPTSFQQNQTSKDGFLE